jgi:hypothetical protein
MRCDDATNLHRRERYRTFDRKYPKENVHSGDILQKKIKQTQFTVGSGVEYAEWTHLLRMFIIYGF